MMDHKASLVKFQKLEIISSIFSDHNTMRLDIDYQKKTVKNHKQVDNKQYATKQHIDNLQGPTGNSAQHAIRTYAYM